MRFEIVAVDFKDVNNSALAGMLSVATMIAVAAEIELDDNELSLIAGQVAISAVRVVATSGPQAEELHDVIDRRSLDARGHAPITTFQKDSLGEFLWNVAFTYQGLDESSEDERCIVVLCIGDTRLRANAESIVADWHLRQAQGDYWLFGKAFWKSSTAVCTTFAKSVPVSVVV